MRYKVRQTVDGWDVVDEENGEHAPFFLKLSAENLAERLNVGHDERHEWVWAQ